MEWTKEQRELPPLDVTQADMDAEISVPGWKHKGIAGLSSIPGQLLACRERQLTAALSEIERLRSEAQIEDGECPLCGKLTNRFASDFSFPVALFRVDGNGQLASYHMKCVMDAIRLRSQLAKDDTQMGELAVGGQWISVIGEEPPTPIKEEMWDADRKRSHAIEKSQVHICIRWGSGNRWYMFRAVFCKAGPLGGNHWYKAGSQITEYPDYFLSIPPFPEPIDNGADELNVALGYDDTHELYASYDDSDSLPAPPSGEHAARNVGEVGPYNAGCAARGHVWGNYNASLREVCIVCGQPKLASVEVQDIPKGDQ